MIEQVKQALPAGFEASLLAIDGHCVGNVESQLEQLPPGLVGDGSASAAPGHPPSVSGRVSADDYSHVSAIEPSAAGGLKISRLIARIATDHDFDAGQSVVYH